MKALSIAFDKTSNALYFFGNTVGLQLLRDAFQMLSDRAGATVVLSELAREANGGNEVCARSLVIPPRGRLFQGVRDSSKARPGIRLTDETSALRRWCWNETTETWLDCVDLVAPLIASVREGNHCYLTSAAEGVAVVVEFRETPPDP